MQKPSKTAPSFDSALSHEPADKRIEILRLVAGSGSISQAARQARVSYKAAWQAIDTLTNLAGVVLVERAVGGTGGGGATITDAGRQLLALSGRLAESRRQVLAEVQDRSTLAAPLAAPALSHVGVRTSMRNQLPCHVARLDTAGQMVRVQLRLAGGDRLVSRITKTSAELLGLKKGLAVLALCKATAVLVEAKTGIEEDEDSHTSSGKPGLSGRVVRISRGATGNEVSLQLDGGLQLVGFAAAGSGLKSKARVNALIEESAVVIALAT